MGVENSGRNGSERRMGYQAHLQLIGQDGLFSAEMKTPGVEICTINIASLIPIMDYAFGQKEWDSRNERYWKDQKWQFQYPDQKQKNQWPETVTKTYSYLKNILEWASDPQTRGHLDPAPGIPVYNKQGEIIKHKSPDFENKTEVDKAVADLASYYFNKGEPHKIKPLLAINIGSSGKKELVGVLTLRWKGDPYVPTGHNIASLERLIVSPKKRGKGIGTKLVATALHYAFDQYNGYSKEAGGKGADEIRTWVLMDRKAGDFQVNYNLFNKLGFRVIVSPYRHWKDYAKLINEKTDREALWFSLKKDKWVEIKEDQKEKVETCGIIGSN
jgi:GNAT superfamily N-acetyltransferase